MQYPLFEDKGCQNAMTGREVLLNAPSGGGIRIAIRHNNSRRCAKTALEALADRGKCTRTDKNPSRCRAIPKRSTKSVVH
jgi:hypothetical protein